MIRKSDRIRSLKLSFCTILLPTSIVLFIALSANATSYYVSQSGKDDSTGRSVGAAWATIGKAASTMGASDTVFVMNGTYVPLKITVSGTASGQITYKAYPGHTPTIATGTSAAWNNIEILASYITIDGFVVAGNNQTLKVADGEANYNYYVTTKDAGGTIDYTNLGKTNCNGIIVNNTSTLRHHVVIKNCIVHDNPGGGISAINADYVTVENNTIYNNCWYMMYAGSGISFFHLSDCDTNKGVKAIVRGNTVYNNYCAVKWISIRGYSDGNGIIIDDNKHTQDGGVPYAGAFLIENNLVFDNGGRGLYLMSSSNATFRNNTSYWNSKSSFSTGGEMVVYDASKVTYVNNIGWANPAYSPNNYAICDNGNWGSNSNITWKYNLTFNGTEGQNSTYFNKTTTTSVDNTNKLGINPQFSNPTIVPANARFNVQSGCPVINAGTSSYGVSMYDITYSARVQGSSVDMGCYEFVPSTGSITNLQHQSLARNQGRIFQVAKLTNRSMNPSLLFVNANGRVIHGPASLNISPGLYFGAR